MSKNTVCVIPSCNNVNTEKIITCSGMCSKTVHAACLKMNNAMFSFFNANTNFKWFCDDCSDMFNMVSRNAEGMFKILQSLSDDVKVIARDMSSVIMDKRTTRSSKRNLIRDAETQPLLSEPPLTAQQPAQLAQPAHNPSPNNDCFIGTGAVNDEEIKAVPVKKLVYASRFSNSTSPDALKKYLSTKLGVSEGVIDCRLLVAANLDVSSLNFVSFKIGVEQDLYTNLLQPSIWPAGILVRDFIHRPKNSNPVGLELI